MRLRTTLTALALAVLLVAAVPAAAAPAQGLDAGAGLSLIEWLDAAWAWIWGGPAATYQATTDSGDPEPAPTDPPPADPAPTGCPGCTDVGPGGDPDG